MRNTAFTAFLGAFLFCFAQQLPAQIVINEFMASNALTIKDPDYQDNVDWIELYNSGTTNVDLSGYLLTDNISDSLKWTIPNGTSIGAGQWLLLWADGKNSGLHTSFGLSKDGEELALFNAAGQKLDEIVFSAQEVDVSYGRKTDGDSSLGYFTTATPGAANNTQAYNGFALFNTHFSEKSGFYNAPLSVAILNPSGKGTVRYTLDGALPTESSLVYTQPIALAQTTVLRARVFRTDLIPGPVNTQTYFIGENFEQRKLPVLSLSTNPANFYDPATGLYVQNFKPEWEYPIHLEFFEPDGLPGFEFDAGVQVGGENAWILPQKLLNIHARKEYGGGSVAFQVFPDNPRADFEDLILRCSGNDWSNTFLRDGLEQGLTQPYMDVDVQDFRPCAVFINGTYLGLHNMRSREDVEYLKLKYKISADSIDLLENEGLVLEGNDLIYQQMIARLNSGVQNDAAFSALAEIMDVENYTDYIISQIFCSNSSWGHNITCYRNQNGGKFRWFLYDYDRGFFANNSGNYAMDWATTTNGQSWSNPAWATLYLRKMLENTAYRTQFLRRFSDHLYVTYNPARINPMVDRLAGNIQYEMEHHQIPRWVGTSSSYGNAIPSFSYWENEVSNLKTFASARNSFMHSDLQSYFSVPGTASLQLVVSAPSHGWIEIDSLRIPTYPWSGTYFQQLPFALQAKPKPGFNFVRWERANSTTMSLIAAGSNWYFYDNITAPASNWNSILFDESTWSEGPAQLGYGDGDEQTLLYAGANSQNKTPAYYFRKQFNISDPSSVSSLQLQLIVDDGAVVYLNGAEVARFNMPVGAVQFNTLASVAISGAGENSWKVFDLPANFLVAGENLLAVEVHQAALNSSDLSFDANLSAVSLATPEVVGTNPVISVSLPDSAPKTYKAVFESDGSCILPDTVYSDLQLFASCSPYLAPGDVTIMPNAVLSVEPGVEIRMPVASDIWVLGGLEIQGTMANPVLIQAQNNAASWGGILIKSPTSAIHLSHFKLKKASAGRQRAYYPAAISAYHATLWIDHFDGTELLDNPVFARYSDINLSDSHLKSNVTGDCINVKNGLGVVENSLFEGGNAIDADAIDFDGVEGGIIRGNTVLNFLGSNDDGLDIGEQCQDLLIENNLIFHCADKGISIGQQSSATVRNNTIAYCNLGMGLKDQSEINIDHNTFFGNFIAVSAYEKHPGDQGGIGIISNCIASNNAIASFRADTTAFLNLTHCLSDTDTLGGTNVQANPLFAAPTFYDFNLQAGSPCLGTGSNGLNIGTLVSTPLTERPRLMFSEILYNDALGNDGEFVELYNPGLAPVDLTGYAITSAVEYFFPTGSSIAAGEYIVAAKNAANYTGPYQVFEWTTGKLSNEGETLLFIDPFGLPEDYVRYDNHAPWPEEMETIGRSLELIDAGLDDHFASSWKIGPWGGTPGAPTIVGTESQAGSTHLSMDVFPNPIDGSMLTIAFQNASNANAIRITDAYGHFVSVVNFEKRSIIQIPTSGWNPGVYAIALLDAGGKTIAVEKLVKI
ncbi:MAG: CotH kinase family protein [Lewinellaceae bacterium]|nr:CotH kinase family protein [Lewinellaceae bacterium]